VSEQEASPKAPSVLPHWRVQACRWLWRGLGFVWGTLIVGIVIGTIANLNTTTTDTPLSRLFIVHLAQAYPLPVESGLGFLAILTLLAWLGSREKQVAVAHPLSEQDRIHMLRRLRMRYEQIRAQSLQGAVQLELGLASRPTAVQNALSLALRVPDQPEQLLPPQTSIVQAYELAQQELLILGEPGAGKSTLLVELAHSLVEQAEQDAARPLPILLPLSSWAEDKCSLDEWLIKEVARLYDVPLHLSQQWIQAEQVLPLLDGLDEMEEAARPACVAAINICHRGHLRPLVVCSRTSEYDTATRQERLALHAAVIVQPLSKARVEIILAQSGRGLASLRIEHKKNRTLQEMATTPLILNLLILTYQGVTAHDLPTKEAVLQQQLLTSFVVRMIECKGNIRHYPLHQTRIWLCWLAQQMRLRQQTIFSMKTLQPDWLPQRQQSLYRWSKGLVFGLLLGSAFGLAVGVIFGLFFGLLFGVVAGLTTAALLFEEKGTRECLLSNI
jgi:GTPase SAR1 family protein